MSELIGAAAVRRGRVPGGIRRVMASFTALGDPGSTNIALPEAVPAVARLIIAAAPMSSKLSMRNSSPNPSSRFSRSASIASNVPSREVMPVPPVVMMILRPRVGELLAHPSGDLGRLVLHDGVARHFMTRLLEQRSNRCPAGVSVRCTGVADRQHITGDRRGRVRLVLCMAHTAIISASARGGTVRWWSACGENDEKGDDIVTVLQSPPAPLAQLDRASGYEPGGRTFESCRAHHPTSLGWIRLHSSVTPRLAFGLTRAGASRAGRTILFKQLRRGPPRRDTRPGRSDGASSTCRRMPR